MNIKTRGEKIDEALESIKRGFIITLLVVWGVLTMFFGIGMISNEMRVHELEEELKVYESIVKGGDENDDKWIMVVDEITGKIIYSDAR